MAGSAKRYDARQAKMYGAPAFYHSNPFPQNTTSELERMYSNENNREMKEKLWAEIESRTQYYTEYMKR